LGKDFEKPTVKQHLAAIRMCFDWLVTGGVLATNPAHGVRGPKHVVKRGDAGADLGSGPDAHRQHRYLNPRWAARPSVDWRDDLCLRAHRRRRGDAGRGYFANGKRWWVRLHEKGGKRHEMPAHRKLEAQLDEYIKAAGIGDDGRAPSSAPPSAAPAN
jgi:hypothetical protein